MVNKQVTGEGEGGEAWVREDQTPGPPQARVNGFTRGRDTVFRAHWSHGAYEKYLHAFATLGPGRAPRGHWGLISASVDLYTLWASIYRRGPGAAKSKVMAVR